MCMSRAEEHDTIFYSASDIENYDNALHISPVHFTSSEDRKFFEENYERDYLSYYDDERDR